MTPSPAPSGVGERAAGLPPWDEELDPDGGPTTAGRSLGVATPARLGRFQVRGLLGSGQYASVYRAFDPDLEREVALKVPQPGALNGPKAEARFLGEARALARLRHPGIVPVFEAGRCGDLPFLATALIDGRTLLDVLDDGPIDCARAAEVAADLAEALGYAHDVGVVHRDVKPANVLVETTGAVHLTDFGLAHRHDVAEPARTGVVVGTPAYIAPEQATCVEERALPEGDQYSLGVVLYEMLCGRPPFVGPPNLVLYSAWNEDPVAPREFRPSVPRSLERICLKAMARDPSERYPTCRHLAADLRAWLARHGQRRPALVRVRRFRQREALGRAARWLRRRPAVAFSTALSLIGLAASTVLATALVVPLAPTAVPTDPGPDLAAPGAVLTEHPGPGRS